ncbi:hypothetical protein PGRAN_08284 [Listeria grandensis FSL F6-0971]|uniref:Uncharacterized protein n=1 Tax=Listeria grandensis FSL F6-0971 TaxID=1265819 RepID=W7BSY6_9LIST|nr:hypothetical protein PGRAN_08284 [Listeria grandensis FSL F6-0971]
MNVLISAQCPVAKDLTEITMDQCQMIVVLATKITNSGQGVIHFTRNGAIFMQKKIPSKLESASFLVWRGFDVLFI